MNDKGAIMPNIVRNGTKLAFEDRGAGRPALVFVHGWACDCSFFASQAEHFSRQHRVLSVDLRGHGKSHKPAGAYPIAAYADDTAYIMEHLGLGKAVAVGHSMGGKVILQLAATHPDCVAAIVMVDPAPFVAPPEVRAVVEAVAASIEAGNQEPRRQLISRMFLPTSDRQLMEKIMTVMLSTPSHVAANALRGGAEFDGPGIAALCKVPALHLAATPPNNPPHLMSEWLPNVVNGWTVGAGHFNQLEVPGQINAMIEAFLRHYV